jgi:hypothetical protein
MTANKVITLPPQWTPPVPVDRFAKPSAFRYEAWTSALAEAMLERKWTSADDTTTLFPALPSELLPAIVKKNPRAAEQFHPSTMPPNATLTIILSPSTLTTKSSNAPRLTNVKSVTPAPCPALPLARTQPSLCTTLTKLSQAITSPVAESPPGTAANAIPPAHTTLVRHWPPRRCAWSKSNLVPWSHFVLPRRPFKPWPRATTVPCLA